MPNETDNFKITDEQMSRAMANWQDEKYIHEMTEAEGDQKIRDEIESTDRHLQMMAQSRQDREATDTEPKPTFEVPPRAQSILDARREEFDKQWEIEDSKSIPRTQGNIREELEAKGIRGEVLDADQVEAAEQGRLAELRDAARAKHSNKIHKAKSTKSKTLRRPLGPNQLRIADDDKKVESFYGKPGETN